MATKALLLDFDGTLVDSVPVLFEGYMSFLAMLGKSGSREEFDELNGYGGKEILQTLCERHQLEGSMGGLVSGFHGQLRTVYETRIEFFPGAVQFLEEVRAAGLKTAIVSSAGRDLVEAVLQAKGVSHLFDAVVTPEGLPRSKPDPAIYVRALAQMGLAADEAIAVEDAIHGMHASLAAKIPTIAMIRDTVQELPCNLLGEARNWLDIKELVLVST